MSIVGAARMEYDTAHLVFAFHEVDLDKFILHVQLVEQKYDSLRASGLHIPVQLDLRHDDCSFRTAVARSGNGLGKDRQTCSGCEDVT